MRIHEKAPFLTGLFHYLQPDSGLDWSYIARMCLFRRDLWRAALFKGMMPFDTELSMAGTATLYAASAAALSPFSIARTTFLMVVRTWDLWLALRRRFRSD